MKTPRIFSALPLCLGLLFVGLPMSSEAQFLNKLSKGLEKVSKGLDKVNQKLDKVTGNTSSTTTSSTSSSTSSSAAGAAGAASNARDTRDWEKVEQTYLTPFISENTKYLRVDPLHDNTIGDVHEGVFAIDHRGKYEFWCVTGELLYGPEWTNPTLRYGDFPYFNSGVCPMVSIKADANGKYRWHLLYLDGSVKELDPTYTAITPFKDGLAVLTQTVNYKKQYCYINVRGEKVYPHIKLNGDAKDAMRPLKDGLRAFRALVNGFQFAWGYMDANGKVVIPAKYFSATDFSEGYAWVKTCEVGPGNVTTQELMLIDKTGKVVLNPGYHEYYSDVVNGKYYLVKGNRSNYEYYDITGKKLGEFNNGMPYYDGYAFVEVDVDGGNDGVKLIGENAEIVRHFSFDRFVAYILDQMTFSPLGTVVYNDMNDAHILNNKGDILITAYEGEGYDRISGFHNFTADGYARMTNIMMNGKDYKGIINTKAELVWLFSEESYTKEWPGWPMPPGPGPWNPGTPTPPQPPKPPVPGPPIGPKVRKQQQYKITVKCEPAEGGTASISPNKSFLYGDHTTLKVKANKDWGIRSIVSDAEGYAVPKVGEPFAVTTDMNLTVNFVKKDTTDVPQHTNAYQGVKSKFIENRDWSRDVEIYAEISATPNVSTPYGDNTYGFITAMMNPNEQLDMPDFTAHLFCAPLNICGYQYDKTSNRHWMVMEGGAYAVGNLLVHPEGAGGLAALYFTMVMAFDGFSDFALTPRRYRMEMLDYNEETGEFTCGAMQTFSRLYGWLPAEDKRLEEKQQGVFVKATDSGLPADLFQGAQMKVAKKRNDVYWYPSAKWYKDDENALKQAIENLGNMYRTLETEYDQMFAE